MVLFLLFLPRILTAQEKLTVRGTINETDGRPMIGVSVVVKGTNIGVASDADGKYELTNVPENAILEISMLSYQTQEISVNNRTTINVEMTEDTQSLEQVVVIGYGTVKKSHLSGSVSSMSSKELNSDLYTNLGAALQGKIPGVLVTASSGNPSSGVNINIRGVSSLSNNNPLYIIDGSIGDISMVNPNDISSIEVLKDASAAAIYGSRAAAGVILINTKSGRREMPTKLDLHLSTGMSMVPKRIQVFNANEYSRFARYYGFDADGFGVEGEEFSGKGTNWHDVMYRTAMTYNANANITGGSKTATYNSSFSYLDQEGIVQKTNNRSFNVRLKSDYNFFKERLKIGQTLIFKSSKGEGYTTGSTIWEILQVPSTMPVYDKTNPYGGWGRIYSINYPNPLGQMNTFERISRNNNLFLNAYAQLKIVDGLQYKLNIGVRKNNSSEREYDGSYDFGAFGVKEQPSLKEIAEQTDSWVLENTLNYDKTFGKHNFNALAGYSAQKDAYRKLEGSNSELLNNNIQTMPGSGSQAAKSNLDEYSLISMFGRIMYSYDDRYLVSASVRRDGSSRFAKGHQFGAFPSASFGWNIHNESFAENLKSIFSQMKLRLSYGKLGNENVGSSYYPTQSVVKDNMNYLQGTSVWYGYLPYVNAVSPENLTWEETETYNFGLDLSFLKGKLNFTVDTYVKKTKDVLLEIPQSSSSGISGMPWQNAGVIDNKGIELSLNYRNAIGDFRYYADLNFGTATNKVKEVVVNGVKTDRSIGGFFANDHGGKGITMFKQGNEMVYFNLVESNGLFQSDAEIKAYVDKNGKMIQPDAKPGDVRYIDHNGDGKIDEDDQHNVGSPFPDFTFGIRLGGEWRGFDLNVFFDGMSGNKIYNYPRYRIESGVFAGNYSKELAKAWTKENPNTDVPRFSLEDGQLNKIGFSDRWLENGSYFRLKNLNIGYTLPLGMSSKVGLEKLRIYATFDNLFVITAYKGYSPDIGESKETAVRKDNVLLSKGVDHGRYPLPRVITFGIQIVL